MTLVIVAYDISDTARRDRAAKTLFSMGFTRMQRSLYIARGGTAKARDAARALSRIIDHERDVVDIIVVPDHYWAARIIVGRGRERVPGRAPSPHLRIVR